MHTSYYDIRKDDHDIIESEFETSVNKKVRCKECEWHGVIKDTKLETVDGELIGLACPRCLGIIEDE